jgi:CubicO group peptidase (beta-lactamase class C family)
MFVLLTLLAVTAPAKGTALAVQNRITEAVDRELQELPSTGAAVGVARNGRIVYVKAFGFRNVAARQKVDAQTAFEIGSVTKQFTAAAILQLAEAGRLSLDDTLAKYVPSFPHADELTLRRLLNQVSGLPDYTHSKDFVTKVSSATDGSLEKVAHLVAGPLDFAPGTRWEYSNTNYYVLGQVVALVSGQSYEEYVRRHLFGAAGMKHSAFIDDESKLGDVATGYWEGDDGKGRRRAVAPLRASWAGGAGSIVSTVSDLVAWDTALANGKIVSRADYVLMSSPATLKNGRKTSYGMGLGLGALYGHRRVWHNGGTNGSLTMDATYPDDRLDIVVFENDLGGDPEQMESAVLGAMFPAIVASARKPADGEDAAARKRALAIIDGTIHGTTPERDYSPQFRKIATPEMQKQIAQEFAPLGAPTAVIYRGKGDTADATRYTYRVEFGARAVIFFIAIDKTTNLIDGIGIKPAQ